MAIERLDETLPAGAVPMASVADGDVCYWFGGSGQVVGPIPKPGSYMLYLQRVPGFGASADEFIAGMVQKLLAGMPPYYLSHVYRVEVHVQRRHGEVAISARVETIPAVQAPILVLKRSGKAAWTHVLDDYLGE